MQSANYTNTSAVRVTAANKRQLEVLNELIIPRLCSLMYQIPYRALLFRILNHLNNANNINDALCWDNELINFVLNNNELPLMLTGMHNECLWRARSVQQSYSCLLYKAQSWCVWMFLILCGSFKSLYDCRWLLGLPGLFIRMIFECYKIPSFLYIW